MVDANPNLETMFFIIKAALFKYTESHRKRNYVQLTMYHSYTLYVFLKIKTHDSQVLLSVQWQFLLKWG